MAWVPAEILPLNPHPASGEWYDAASMWRTPISDYTIDPNSETHVAYRLSAGDGEGEFYQAPRFLAGPDYDLGEYDYDHPIYWAKAGDLECEVTLEEEWSRGVGEEEIEGDTILVPSYAIPSGGSDGHMAVVQPDGITTYDFWEADAPAGGVLNARWGGKSYMDGTGTHSNATAALYALGAGIIRPEEMLQGSIDHPLFTVDHYCNGTMRSGALGTGRVDSEQTALGAPPMGAHWFLDISDNEIAQADPWAQILLRCCRDYGLITGDTGGGCFKLDTSRESVGTDRWQPVIDYYDMATDGDGNAWFDLSEFADWENDLHLLAEPS